MGKQKKAKQRKSKQASHTTRMLRPTPVPVSRRSDAERREAVQRTKRFRHMLLIDLGVRLLRAIDDADLPEEERDELVRQLKRLLKDAKTLREQRAALHANPGRKPRVDDALLCRVVADRHRRYPDWSRNFLFGAVAMSEHIGSAEAVRKRLRKLPEGLWWPDVPRER